MNMKELMFLKAGSGGGKRNLLDYSDFVNKNYGGNANMHNVRPENPIAVDPGAQLILRSMRVSETNIRFYDESKTYQSAHSISKYGVTEFTFTVPDGMYYILPKWYLADEELPIETFIASNPVIQYV